jgi:DNA-directed RNA polymerase subunit RPC12/RpoP
MDPHTISEVAYKNGYADGIEDAQKRNEAEWVITGNDIVCSKCGTVVSRYYGPDSLEELTQHKFCHYCGSRIIKIENNIEKSL